MKNLFFALILTAASSQVFASNFSVDLGCYADSGKVMRLNVHNSEGVSYSVNVSVSTIENNATENSPEGRVAEKVYKAWQARKNCIKENALSLTPVEIDRLNTLTAH